MPAHAAIAMMTAVLRPALLPPSGEEGVVPTVGPLPPPVPPPGVVTMPPLPGNRPASVMLVLLVPLGLVVGLGLGLAVGAGLGLGLTGATAAALKSGTALGI
jgi:hypothetical protein